MNSGEIKKAKELLKQGSGKGSGQKRDDARREETRTYLVMSYPVRIAESMHYMPWQQSGRWWGFPRGRGKRSERQRE